MKKCVFAIVALAGATTTVLAQAPEANGSQMRFEVLNGATWGSSINANPGETVDFRVVVSYTGTRTDLLALGNARFQPTFSNFDNSGTGADRDNFRPWLNGGTSGNNIPGSLLSQAEGNSTATLPAYGRVFPFGSTAMNSGGSNILTEFRHDGGANRAPAGSWARLSGSFGSNWPLPALTTTPVATNELLGILRGVAASQLAQASAGSAWQGGTQNIVIFRGAITLSNDGAARTITISNAEGSLLRVGNAQSADDARYIAWQESATDLGSYRTAVNVVSGAITVIPSPASLALLGLGGLAAARRRRA
ncbi:MAG TPA: hypothetical protein VD971_07600 [Phycisphaerales bacterium]|nr:hypothetical protein [Phycisphaerales bacterium]